MSEPFRLPPDDAHNRALAGHVHPPDWTNPEPAGQYDLVVLGAGTGGLVSAAAGAGMGKRVALVERGLMGGDCLNLGCVPSKAILRCARAAAEVRRAGELGVRGTEWAEADFGAVMERMRRLRSEIAPHDGAERLRGLGVDVFFGDASFTGSDRVAVGESELPCKRAVIATGGRPTAPPVPGLEEAGYLTNETVFSLTERPGRIGVIGAGPIGCELAQAFARLGSDVTLIEAAHGVLPREERDAAAIVQRALEADGVRVLCCGKQMRVSAGQAEKHISLASHGGEHQVTVDEILVATGRAPNVEGLGLDVAGIEYDGTGVRVDDRLRTSNPRVFAVGDVTPLEKFTHAADAHARIAARNALLPWLPFKARASKLTVPACTYTEPELAHVGATRTELETAGARFETIEVSLGDVDRAILDGATDGLVKLHVARGSGRILGATVAAPDAGNLIGEIATAMRAGMPLQKLSGVIHPYPTLAEAIKRAGDQYFKRRLLAWRDALTRPFTGKHGADESTGR